MVNRRCRAKPASIAAAFAKPGRAGDGASRFTVLRITIATPIATSRRVTVQRIRMAAGLGFTGAAGAAVNLRAAPPGDPRGWLAVPAGNTPAARPATTPAPLPPH